MAVSFRVRRRPGATRWPDEESPAEVPVGQPAPAEASRHRSFLVAVGAIVSLGVVSGVMAAGTLGRGGPSVPALDVVLAPESAPDAPAATGSRTAPAGPARVQGWADRLAQPLGIPPVALAAYGSAELDLRAERPGCHLSWAALAAIGSVESDHNRFGGAVLGSDGRARPPVIGVPLDGRPGVAVVRDTDDGALDGDTGYDRAVGPMQFLPGTWSRWAADGDRDGRADPFALPDAALAAARYLCASGGGDLRTGPAWSAAVLTYNRSTDYLRTVTARNDDYVRRSFGR